MEIDTEILSIEDIRLSNKGEVEEKETMDRGGGMLCSLVCDVVVAL